MKSLTGKTAVVTGAASGIGFALAERFVREGMNVVLADIEEPALEAAVKELADLGPVVGVRTDVSSAGDVDALAVASREAFGPVHVLCNNAGVGVANRVERFSLADWEWALGVNLWGVVHGLRAFLPAIIEQGEGHVVTTTSMAGFTATPLQSPYVAAKHAVVGITETLYQELLAAKSEVGVSLLIPGFVATRIMESSRNRPDRAEGESFEPPEHLKQLIAAAKPPSEVADLVVDAILTDKFYVFTDDEHFNFITTRHRDIEERRNPTPVRLDFMRKR